MKYGTPELTALNAINAIQAEQCKKSIHTDSPLIQTNDVVAGYMDWEG